MDTYRTSLGFLGVEIVTSDTMTKDIEDWSEVRSPGRARRRRAIGHRQNIIIRTVPRTDAIHFQDPTTGARKVVMHPTMYAAITDRLARRVDADISAAFHGLPLRSE